MAVERLVDLGQWLPGTVTLWMFSVVLVMMAAFYAKKRRDFIVHCNSIPGPPAPWPILGNAMELLLDPDDMFKFLIGFLNDWKRDHPILRFWAGPFPIFMIYTPEAAETLLASNKLIDKCREYDYLHPWLNTGLLTSTGSKWHVRRKMLTPAFHFKILEDFVDIFNEQSRVLVHKLHTSPETGNPNGFNIFPFIALCTLDIICDTAMGRNVNAQSHDDSDYVRAVSTISRIVQTRQARPWLQPELFFKLTPFSKIQRQCLETLHGFTDKAPFKSFIFIAYNHIFLFTLVLRKIVFLFTNSFI
jgi:cytochrome P450 family 4